MSGISIPEAGRYVCACVLFLALSRALPAQEFGTFSPEPSSGDIREYSKKLPLRKASADTDANSSSGDVSAPPIDRYAQSPNSFTWDERVDDYEHSFRSVQSIIGPALGAGISQTYNSPHEWGAATPGFGRRLASSNATSILGRTVGFGVAAADHEDPRFYSSGETDLWRRARHAIVGTFVSRTPHGRMPAFSRFAGIYAAAFLSNAWQPPSQNGVRPALQRGSITLSSSVGFRLLQEFWPDIRHAIYRH
jgi:hypothetical protein